MLTSSIGLNSDPRRDVKDDHDLGGDILGGDTDVQRSLSAGS